MVVIASALLFSPCARGEDKLIITTENEDMGYQSWSSGDPLSNGGAQVTISAAHAEAGKFGGVVYKTSSEGWTNKVATLSATIAPESFPSKPAIWLRADGGTGKSLKFVTSAGRPISEKGDISIDLRIPPNAKRIVFGVVMHGSGATKGNNVRLRESAHVLPGNEATAKEVYQGAMRAVSDNAYRFSNLSDDSDLLNVELSDEPGTGYQAEKSIRMLLRALKDSHSFYATAEDGLRYSDGGADPEAVEAKLVDGKFGYVSIPGVFGTNAELATKFATEVDGKISKLRRDARCGWVVDLRKDNGGNMWPMVSALSVFFGDGKLGGFKARNGDINWWSLDSPSVIPVPGVSEAQDAKIAVLIGPKTTSSGEAVAVAFVGRENTRIFGAPSNGKASSNRKFMLADGSAVWLMAAVDVDRSGREVGERVVPDTVLQGDVVSSSEIPEDALTWLSSSCPHD